jgi:hypothetical protein
MAVPVWVPGQVLAASDVNTWFVPLAAVKTVDQSVTSSTTLVNDNVLAVPVAASSTYEFRLFCWFQAAAGGDFKFQFAGPAGATMGYNCVHNEGGATGLTNSTITYGLGSATTGAGGGAGVNEALSAAGVLVVVGTSGTLQLTWAQGTSSGTATILKATSHLVLRRVA